MLTIKGWKARTKSGDTATLLHSALQARTSAGQKWFDETSSSSQEESDSRLLQTTPLNHKGKIIKAEHGARQTCSRLLLFQMLSSSPGNGKEARA